MAQPPAAPTVSQDITLHCLDDGGQDVAFVASFGYRADDPYAVWLTFHIPGGDVSWAVARSLLLKGLTADYLLRDLGRVQRGTRILVHAAAGGV
eukprot:gene479-553_t